MHNKVLNNDRTDRKKTWTFVIYIFCALFAPPVLAGINLILPLALYSLFLIVTKYRKDIRTVFVGSGLNKLVMGFVLYYIYCACIVAFSVITGDMVQTGHYIRMAYSFLLLFPVSFVCVLYILLRARELEYTLRDLLQVFIYAGLIQAALALLTLLVPEVKDFFVTLMYENTGDPLLDTPWVVNIRFFGFANSMLDLYGFGMGIIAAFALFLATDKRYSFILLFPILLIPSILNARTGLLISAAGVVFFFAYLIIKMRSVTLLVTIASICLIALVSLKFVSDYAPDTIAWASRDIGSLFGADQSQGATASALFSDRFWTIPQSVPGLLFGTGHTLYQADGYQHSDVGYINDLWRTGIVGLFLLYIPFLAAVRRSIRLSKDSLASVLSLFFLCAMAIFLIKGSIWAYSPGIVIILSVLTYSVLMGRGQNNMKEAI